MTDEELTNLIADILGGTRFAGMTSYEQAGAVVRALREANVLPVWWTIDSAPNACHVLAYYFDNECGEGVMQFIHSPPSAPFTHWCIPSPPENVT